ncbi:MAG: HD domain-containing protein [bacterium]
MVERDLHSVLFIKEPDKVLEEVEYICNQIREDFDLSFIHTAYQDVIDFFNGDYPGYRACNTEYHDLDHTMDVFLATARLVHGAHLKDKQFTPEMLEVVLLSALFHDVGYIQKEGDTEGTGAKFTKYHEERGISILREYLRDKGHNGEIGDLCEQVILCTDINLSLEDITFKSKKIEYLGKLIGTADIIAQLADRYYLEKLLLLYRESEESGINSFNSERELMEKTVGFYENYTRRRIDEEFDSLYSLNRLHFKHRWDVDRDLYSEYIQKNLDYLQEILEESDESYRERLRRAGIVKKLSD